MVSKCPELLLPNNALELAVRQRARKRDVSFGPRTEDGVRVWNTFANLAKKSIKLGVSSYRFLHESVTDNNLIPHSADLVSKRAKERNLVGGRSRIFISIPQFIEMIQLI